MNLSFILFIIGALLMFVAVALSVWWHTVDSRLSDHMGKAKSPWKAWCSEYDRLITQTSRIRLAGLIFLYAAFAIVLFALASFLMPGVIQ